jgi:hypothetical protein
MLLKMSRSLNERMNFVTPRISDMLQNSRHVLYWSHSCFSQVPKLILDVYTSLGGEIVIIFRFRHSSNNNEASWAMHLLKTEVLHTLAHIMLITVWSVKSASNKSDDLFCSAPHAMKGDSALKCIK